MPQYYRKNIGVETLNINGYFISEKLACYEVFVFLDSGGPLLGVWEKLASLLIPLDPTSVLLWGLAVLDTSLLICCVVLVESVTLSASALISLAENYNTI